MKNPIYSLLITFPKQGNKNPFLLDFLFLLFSYLLLSFRLFLSPISHPPQFLKQLLVRLDWIYFTKIENWKHCNKIIFKCMNSTMGPIFNEKVAEKWNLWIREQYTSALFTVKKSTNVG